MFSVVIKYYTVTILTIVNNDRTNFITWILKDYKLSEIRDSFLTHLKVVSDLDVCKFYFIMKLIATMQEDLSRLNSPIGEDARCNVANLARLHIDIRILRDCWNCFHCSGSRRIWTVCRHPLCCRRTIWRVPPNMGRARPEGSRSLQKVSREFRSKFFIRKLHLPHEMRNYIYFTKII